MFSNCTEETLDKVYDWITYTYYSPQPKWNERDNVPERRRARTYAIHALDDMRALYAGVGNNGWWEEDRISHLEELHDIIPYSMEQVLNQNNYIREYDQKHEEEIDSHENYEGGSWGDEDEEIFVENNAPEIVKMQGNKDGKLYEYTSALFWDSVEWFMNNHGWWQELEELKKILEAEKEPEKKPPKNA